MRSSHRARAGLVLLLAAGLFGPLAAQAPPPVVSPLSQTERLQAENLKLRAQVLELQRALAQVQLERESATLNADRQALEATFRLALKPAAGHVFDWTTLAFGPPKVDAIPLPTGSKP
jgi:hypothetical protein